MENNAIKLWIPQQSDFTTNYNWLYENYPPEFRMHSIIVHSEDILTPAAIQKVQNFAKYYVHRRYLCCCKGQLVRPCCKSSNLIKIKFQFAMSNESLKQNTQQQTDK